MPETPWRYRPDMLPEPLTSDRVQAELQRIAKTFVEAPPLAVLEGVPSAVTLNTTSSPMVGYANKLEGRGFEGLANTANGQITIPVDGWYAIEGWCLGGMASPSSNGQWQMELGRTPGGNTIIEGLDIGSIVPMLNRTAGNNLKIQLNKGDVVWLALLATVAMGTFTFGAASFAVELVQAT